MDHECLETISTCPFYFSIQWFLECIATINILFYFRLFQYLYSCFDVLLLLSKYLAPCCVWCADQSFFIWICWCSLYTSCNLLLMKGLKWCKEFWFVHWYFCNIDTSILLDFYDIIVRVLGPISRISNLMEISFCYHSDCNEEIAMKFCTWHDSCSVVAYTKFGSDIIPNNGVTPEEIFRRILITME